MKTLKLLVLPILAVSMLAACAPAALPAAPTPVMAGATLVLQPATPTNSIVPAQTRPAVVVDVRLPSPLLTAVPLNAPVWVTYDYTCEIASGGSNMTMRLVWADRSDNEQGFIIYRDKQAIATLSSNETSFLDTAFLLTGQARTYSVEAFYDGWHASTSTIINACG